VRAKGFAFPGAYYIQKPVTQAMSKTLRMIAVAGVYFIAGKLGLLLANVHTSVSPVWPATGIALAALLGWGIELWPAVFIGALLVNVSAALPADTSILLRVAQALGIGIGNTLEALVAAQLVIRFAGARNPFQQVANVFRYTFLAGSLSTAVSATIGTLTLLACGFMRAHAYPAAWLTWWLGDMIGAMLVAPLILLWTAKPGLRPGMNRTVEALLLLISILMISAINFSDLFPFGAKHYPLTFFFLPFILWAALRFESRGVVAFLALITCLAINGTWHGYGSYAMAGQNGSLLMLQTFICVATFAALVLAAAANERKTAEEQYRKLNLELEQRVQQRTAQLEGTNKELEAFC